LRECRVRFTATARRHVDRERTWWLENRDYQALFSSELEAGLRILALLPGSGTPYRRTNVAGLRRLYLDKVASHLYYTFNDEEVVIRALWGARRERGPSLRQASVVSFPSAQLEVDREVARSQEPRLFSLGASILRMKTDSSRKPDRLPGW